MISGEEDTRDSLLKSSVDMGVRVRERALDGEDSGVSNLLPRSVITASVTTPGLNVVNGEVLFNRSLGELRQLAIGVVCATSSRVPFLTQAVISNWLIATILTPRAL